MSALQPTYNTKNVFTLVLVFFIVIWLLYSLGLFFHKTAKIHDEIKAIEAQNEQTKQEIEEKKRYLEYLRTPQRIDKEAKIQMGRKQAGEQVLVFIEEEVPLLPTEQAAEEAELRKAIPNIEKWWHLLAPKSQ